MKFFKTFIIIVSILIVILFIVPFFLSSHYHMEREIVIDKNIDDVYPIVLDYNQRINWDPWLEEDPNTDIKVDISPDIIGTIYTWDGEIIGSGKLTIKEIETNQKIISKIEFYSPQQMVSDVIWNFKSENDKTIVTWALKGNLKYPFEKWFGLFMDKTLGKSFEKGLENLKKYIEDKPDQSFSK